MPGKMKTQEEKQDGEDGTYWRFGNRVPEVSSRRTHDITNGLLGSVDLKKGRSKHDV
jgi:hypothetical protein